MTGKICLKSPHSSMHIPPMGWLLPVKSLRVQSNASNASLFVIGASSTTITLPSWITLQSAVPFLMLYMGTSIACKSSGTLNVLCKVRPPVNSVAAMPLDAVANAILPSDRSCARIRLIYLYHLERPKITCHLHYYQGFFQGGAGGSIRPPLALACPP